MQMKKSLLLKILCLLLGLSLSAKSSGETYTYMHYSPEKGLQDRRTFASAKDAKGYLWIATRTSIDRFDGKVFRHYKLPFIREEERIRCVNSSPDGERIYAISNKCVYRYDHGNDQFSLAMGRIDPPAITQIHGLRFDKEGTVCLLTDKGIYYETDIEGEWRSLDNTSQCEIYDAAFTSDSCLYAATPKGVLRGRIGQGRLETATALEAIPPIRILSLHFDESTRKLWIGSFSEGLFLYDELDSTARKLPSPQVNVPVRTITAVNDDAIWVATDGLGILEYNKRDGSFRKKIGDHITGSVPNNLYHILSDGPIAWISSYSNGLFAIYTQNIVERIYRFGSSADRGLTRNHVNAILEDRNENLWFATNGGIFRYDNEQQTIRPIYVTPGESNQFLALFEDSEGKIWAGGYSTKILRIDPATSDIVGVQIVPGRNNYHVYSIVEDTYGNLLFGSAADRLIIYDPRRETGRYLPLRGSYSMLPCRDGSVLVGGVSGLYRLNPLNGSVTAINLETSTHTRNPFIYNMTFADSDELGLWITTDGQGLWLVDLKSRNVQSWTSDQGLSSNYLYGFGFDKLNRLWITSENGLNCFNPATGQIIRMHGNIGLPSWSFNFGAFAKRHNGNIVCGTPNEAIEVDPLSPLLNNQTQANLHFSDLTVYNTTHSTEYAPRHIPVDDLRTLRLDYRQNAFSIEFANLNQLYGDLSTCRWKLTGIDNDWIYSDHGYRAMYSNLRPGKYLFTLEAVLLGSHQVLQQRLLQIVITPPFYATWWAICIYLLFGAAVSYLGYRYYLNLMESRRSDEKIRFFINMAHDIRTPITLIKAPLNEIEQDALSENSRAALRLALSNVDKLFRRVTQLLDFQKLERKAMKLQVEQTALNNFFYNSIMSFHPIARQKQINLTAELLPETLQGWIDQPKVLLILENLISNAVKYTDPGGNVAVRLGCDGRWLTIEVIDDGIGIPSSAQSKIFSRFYRADNASNSQETGSGIGLLLVKRLVSLHKGHVSFVSTPRCGTIFTVRIPYRQSDYSSAEQLMQSGISLPEKAPAGDIDKYEYSVLIVEDNDELRSYLSAYLRKKYRVLEAENGRQAVDMATTNNIDLIISDVMMPVMDGFEMCKTLKSDIATSHIPIILLTSLTEREHVIRGISSGAEDYIGKPFDLLILETKIDNMIKKRSQRKERFIENNGSEHDDSFGQLTAADRNFLDKFYELVGEKMSDELYTVEKMSYDLAMSYSVFYRKIKTLLGISPKELVMDLKMKRAAELLKEQKYNIGEIAYLVGFPNAKYFSTAFKKHYGVSPTSYVQETLDH